MSVSRNQLLKTVQLEKNLEKVNVFFLTVFIITHCFPKSKRFLLKSKKKFMDFGIKKETSRSQGLS